MEAVRINLGDETFNPQRTGHASFRREVADTKYTPLILSGCFSHDLIVPAR